MRAAVTGGTCRAANLPGLDVCGKTGTAQNRGKDHSAFMGFAPMNDPKIAVSVYVENGGWGATYGVPIGALIIEKYLNGELSPQSEVKANDIQNRRIDYGIHER
jgi:penicillin-binding protein 2